jgi:regulator of replication initiation timing
MFLFRAVAVERDQLKDQLAQLERDNRQLTFENETLLYRVRQRTLSLNPPSRLNSIPSSKQKLHHRAYSFSSIFQTNQNVNTRPKRSLSLDCFLYR